MMTDERWVAAAPFRAHLNHVCASTSTPWTVVALHAGLPIGLVHDLLDTRPGRRVHRIAPELARRVLTVTVESVRRLDAVSVPARTARQAIHRLMAGGWTCVALGRRLRMSVHELDALANGTLPEVPALLELRLAALLATSERPAASQRSPLAA